MVVFTLILIGIFTLIYILCRVCVNQFFHPIEIGVAEEITENDPLPHRRVYHRREWNGIPDRLRARRNAYRPIQLHNY